MKKGIYWFTWWKSPAWVLQTVLPPRYGGLSSGLRESLNFYLCFSLCGLQFWSHTVVNCCSSSAYMLPGSTLKVSGVRVGGHWMLFLYCWSPQCPEIHSALVSPGYMLIHCCPVKLRHILHLGVKARSSAPLQPHAVRMGNGWIPTWKSGTVAEGRMYTREVKNKCTRSNFTKLFSIHIYHSLFPWSYSFPKTDENLLLGLPELVKEPNRSPSPLKDFQ